MSESRLRVFYAVTQWSGNSKISPGVSVYQVAEKRRPGGTNPWVKKVALFGSSGIAPGRCLLGGPHVGISSATGQLVVFCSQGGRSAEETILAIHGGGNTRPVVAMFFKKVEALACAEALHKGERNSDWNKTSRKVIEAIGFSHPVFILKEALLGRFPVDKQ